MRIAILKEHGPSLPKALPPPAQPPHPSPAPIERRVPIVPDSVKRFGQKKISIVVEAGAGQGAFFSDTDYLREGATLAPDASAAIAAADALMRLRIPTLAEVAAMKEGAALFAPLLPLVSHELVTALAARNITAFAVDFIPRTTMAQMMDVLSSQSAAAGYGAVVLAAGALPRFFPMLITAAGTIAPATLLVLGAGVAGLSAVGTGKRLGARVEAFDVRKVAKEQVESLGARFVEVESDEDAQAAGGYAKEVSDEYKRKQAEVLARHVAKADAIICTALIPGKRAPVLVTDAMLQTMKPGSIVVDLAAEQGGNCEGSQAGQTIVKHGVTIVGAVDLPSHLAVHASQMWSRNMEKLLFHLTKDGELKLDLKDEVTRGCLITHGGAVVQGRVREAMGLGALAAIRASGEGAA